MMKRVEFWGLTAPEKPSPEDTVNEMKDFVTNFNKGGLASKLFDSPERVKEWVNDLVGKNPKCHPHFGGQAKVSITAHNERKLISLIWDTPHKTVVLAQIMCIN